MKVEHSKNISGPKYLFKFYYDVYFSTNFLSLLVLVSWLLIQNSALCLPYVYDRVKHIVIDY